MTTKEKTLEQIKKLNETLALMNKENRDASILAMRDVYTEYRQKIEKSLEENNKNKEITKNYENQLIETIESLNKYDKSKIHYSIQCELEVIQQHYEELYVDVEKLKK